MSYKFKRAGNIPRGIIHSEHVDISSTDWTIPTASLDKYGPPDAIHNGSNSAGDIVCTLADNAAAMLFKSIPVGIFPLSVTGVTKTGTAAAMAAADGLEVVWYARENY